MWDRDADDDDLRRRELALLVHPGLLSRATRLTAFGGAVPGARAAGAGAAGGSRLAANIVWGTDAPAWPHWPWRR